jgi:hypothetical protein
MAEFREAEAVLREEFAGTSRAAPSEVIAVLLVMSDGLRQVFAHENFGTGHVTPAELPVGIAARILGSRDGLDAGYLSGVISGPIDADKLDYMARDSHHAGLPLGLDIHRLISKLEVVTVTPGNAPKPELRERAQQERDRRFYEMGISLAGLGAYEQMIIARVILYDRLYYHHKVRAAEAMVRRLVRVAEEERGDGYTPDELLVGWPDDTFIHVLGGELTSDTLRSGDKRARDLADAIVRRDLYHRAFAFAARFMEGLLQGLPEKDEAETRAALWKDALRKLESPEGRSRLETAIVQKAQALQRSIPALAASPDELRPEHVIVDFPVNKVVVRGGDILTRTEDGHLGTPNLFFDPERWSQAYEHNKQCGFVFAPQQHVPLVALASRIVFHEELKLVMGETSDRASKTQGLVKPEWLEQAGRAGHCSAESMEVLVQRRPQLLPFLAEHLKSNLPDHWLRQDPQLAERLAEQFHDTLPAGLPASAHRAVLDALQHLAWFVDTVEKAGTWVKKDRLDEVKDLQAELRRHLNSREVDVREGETLGGGASDLILPGSIVVENKVCGDTVDPFAKGPHYAWQARRYSIAICMNVTFVILAYRPKHEAAILPLPQRILVAELPGAPETRAQVRIVIPWGQPVPHDAKAPT